MPTVPTYEAHVGLDPDAAPLVHYDTSEFQAAGQKGRALQGLGSALEAAGQQAQQVQERAAQKQQEQNNWETGLQSRALDQRLQTAFNDHLNGDTGDGSGFAKGYLTQADQLAQQTFDQMPAGPAKERAIQAWQVLGRSGLQDQAARAQIKLQGAYSTQQIGQMLDTDQKLVSQDPAHADALLQQAQFQIMNAQGLSAQEKAAAISGYQRNILGTELATRYATDPDGMRMALGLAAPGSAGSTFTRMVRAESSGNPNAVSPKGALGLAQVMPDTAREVAGSMGLHELADMSDAQLKSYFQAHPEVNTQIGRTYFNQLLQRYHGDQEAAVVAYNAGPGRADDWLRKGKDDDVLPAETKAYRNKVVGAPGADHPDFHMADTAEVIPSSKTVPGGIGSDAVASMDSNQAGAALLPYLTNQRSPASVLQLNPIFSSRIQQALASAPPEVQQATRIASGFRSDDHQVDLYAAAVQKYGSEEAARKWVAPPGHSNHNSGQAMDLSYKSDVARQWWHDNADRFGLKFPLANENWHIEPKETRGGGGLPSSALAGGGGTLNPKYASLTFADTQRLVAGAEAGLKRVDTEQQQQLKLDSFNTSRMVDDDVQSLASTGQGVSDLDPGRVAAVLGPQKAQQWQEQRAQALDVYKGTSGMDAMSNDQLEQHAEQFRPGPQDAGEGFSRKQAVYDAVQKQAADILKQRAADPAAVADKAPAVQASHAGAAANPADLTQWQPIVAARMAHQASLGIPEGSRQPITKAEAVQVMGPVNNTPAGLDGPAMKEAINRLEAMVGPQYAPRALQFAMQQAKVDDETSRTLSNLMYRATKNQPPSQTDVQKLNDVTAGAALRNSPFMPPQPSVPAAAPAASTPRSSPAVATPPDAGASRVRPSDNAIRALIRNPSKTDDFDAMFGAGSAKRAIDQFKKMQRAING